MHAPPVPHTTPHALWLSAPLPPLADAARIRDCVEKYANAAPPEAEEEEEEEESDEDA